MSEGEEKKNNNDNPQFNKKQTHETEIEIEINEKKNN